MTLDCRPSGGRLGVDVPTLLLPSLPSWRPNECSVMQRRLMPLRIITNPCRSAPKSGLHRARYPPPATSSQCPLPDCCHTACASQVRELLKVVTTEYDVYSPTHVFPTRAYDLLKLNIRAFLSYVMMLVYPLQVM